MKSSFIELSFVYLAYLGLNKSPTRNVNSTVATAREVVSGMKPFPKLLLVCLPGVGKQGLTPDYIERTSTATPGQCVGVVWVEEGGGRFTQHHWA